MKSLAPDGVERVMLIGAGNATVARYEDGAVTELATKGPTRPELR